MAVRRWGPETELGAAGVQRHPDVAALPGGGFVTAWLDLSDPAGATVRFQRHDATGKAVGAQGLLSAPGGLAAPTVTALAGGGFRIDAEQRRTPADSDVVAFRFDASGAALGRLAVDDTPGLAAARPAVARAGAGSVAVYEQGGDLFARIQDGAGAALAGPLPVNATTLGPQDRPDVAGLAGGGFVATWTDGNLGRIHARVFGADGTPWNIDEVVVNTTPLGGNPGHPAVAALADGGFVLAWEAGSSPYPNAAPDVRMRIFDPLGVPLGRDVVANAATLGAQGKPEVVALRSGGFVVAWLDLAGTPTLRGQVFDAAGQRIGGAFSVNTHALAPDMGAGDLALAELTDGRLVVAWTGLEEDGSVGIVQQIVDPRDGVVEGTAQWDVLHGHDAWGDEISGFGGSDTLAGLLGDDLLLGGDGNDLIQGGRGDDQLLGGRGNDTLLGGAGGDDLTGGTGSDLASYTAAAAGVAVALDGSLAAAGEAAGDVLLGVEGLLGSGHADTLRGLGGTSFLRGNGGNDTLEGLGGNDSLLGDAGDDRLLGGAGADTMSGGVGVDEFVFLSAGDSPVLGRDQVSDFLKGSDRLVLTAIDANPALAGDQAFVLDANASFSLGEVRQVRQGANLLVEVNANTDAAAELSVLLLNVTGSLAVTDFLL